jgi:tetratricopeptide (TPR) repeat protein
MKLKIYFSFLFILFFLQSNSQLHIDGFILRSKYDIINNEFVAAIEKINKVIKVEADNYEAYYLRGIAKFNLGDYIGADYDFTKSSSINPFFANSLHYLAITKNKTFEYNEALLNFEKALEYDPFNHEIYLNKGISNSMVQNYQEAISDFDQAIKLNTNYAIAYLARGSVKTILEDYNAALED